MWFTSVLVALASFVPTIASPLALRDVAVKHSWQDIVPQGWERHSVPSPDHVINLQIGLKQHRFEELAATLRNQ